MPKLNTVYDIGAAFEAIENELISSMIRNMRRRLRNRFLHHPFGKTRTRSNRY